MCIACNFFKYSNIFELIIWDDKSDTYDHYIDCNDPESKILTETEIPCT